MKRDLLNIIAAMFLNITLAIMLLLLVPNNKLVLFHVFICFIYYIILSIAIIYQAFEKKKENNK